jgi:exonuclease III
MNILAWNCRGLADPRTVQELCALIRTHNPGLVFLSETWQNKDRMEKLRKRFGLKYYFAVQSDNKGGGIALFWDESLDVVLQSFSHRHIDALIKENSQAMAWRASFVYGGARSEHRHKTWDLLSHIRFVVNEPWMVIDDLNEAMWQFEHFSQTKRNERQMELFRDVVDSCGLHDLSFIGLPWTYDNRRKGDRNVKVRLDRCLCSDSWRDLWPDASLHHLTSSRSDHCPILICLFENTK